MGERESVVVGSEMGTYDPFKGTKYPFKGQKYPIKGRKYPHFGDPFRWEASAVFWNHRLHGCSQIGNRSTANCANKREWGLWYVGWVGVFSGLLFRARRGKI